MTASQAADATARLELRSGQHRDEIDLVKKSRQERCTDVKSLLRLCHNKLHARGNDGDESDLTMDMVRILLAKARDEQRPGDEPLFYCTAQEYQSEAGQRAAAARVQSLFREQADANPEVFGAAERISVGARGICDVVSELQGYRLLSGLDESQDWDLVGSAYEQYTATYLKRQQGQFFTNRLITDFMVAVVDPGPADLILDPAGGSGGFLSTALRYVRRKILARAATGAAGQRQLDRYRGRLFMVEINRRLVKIAKTAMILSGGDGPAGMTHGDGLGPYDKLNELITRNAGRGKPTIILTNPPFAGVGEGVPPELLFFERCLDWLAPGGKLAIVMPKSLLDTQTFLAARKLLLDRYRLLAVVTCHKNTFQPHTGVRTCLVFVARPGRGESVPRDYPIFMAVSRHVGQDSEGAPVFRRDDQNLATDVLDEDLHDILRDWRAHLGGVLVESEYRFSVNRSVLDAQLRINPQFHLPGLNRAIKEIQQIDGREGWSVVGLSQVMPDVQIYKGPRMKTEDLIVEAAAPDVEPYYTPSAVLQEKNDSVKLLKTGHAKKTQLRMIKALRVRQGDLLVTRSGTIGRVAYVTPRLDGAIVSDDMIRVRIPDDAVRYYVYAFLQSPAGISQMLRNEYGAVQQHLEPSHLKDLLVPVPPRWQDVEQIVALVRASIEARANFEAAHADALQATAQLLSALRGLPGGFQ